MRQSKRKMDAVAYLILILGALLILFPLYITVITTFKTSGESASSFFTLPKSFCTGKKHAGNTKKEPLLFTGLCYGLTPCRNAS